MHTIRPDGIITKYRGLTAHRPLAALGLFVCLGVLGLAGCNSTAQRASTNSKPGNNAPHEERNPSQHPEQFRSKQ